MSNIRFYNFPASTTILEACSKCDNKDLFTNVGSQYFIDTIQYTNVSGAYLFFNGLKREIIYDADATFSKNFDTVTRTSATIVSNFKHIAADTTACKSAAAANLSRWDSGLVCDQTVKVRRVTFTNIADTTLFNLVPMKVQKIANVQEIVPEDSTSFS